MGTMMQPPNLPSYSPFSPTTLAGPASPFATRSNSEVSTQYSKSSTSMYGSDLLEDTDTLAPLPTYCPGTSVEPVTEQNALYSMAKVLVNDPKETYDIGDLIQGTIKFSPVKNVQLHAISIVLECKVGTVYGKWPSSRKTKRRMVLTHYVVPSTSLPRTKRACPKKLYTFPFTLQIPQAQTQHTSCELGLDEHMQLPPSMGSLGNISHLEYNVPGDVARINYQLRALVQIVEPDQDKPVSFCIGIEYLHFTPSYFPSIASLHQLSRQEFSIRQKLKKYLWTKVAKRTVGINVLHLPVLSMTSTQTVNIPIQLSFSPDQLDPASPPLMVSKITTQLVAQTFYSYSKEIPIAKEKSEKEKVVQPFLLSKLSIGTTAWKLDDSNTSAATPTYSTTLEVPVLLPQARHITPTFESCLVSRDYKLEVTVHFENKSKVAIVVPAVVVARLPPRISPIPTDPSASIMDLKS